MSPQFRSILAAILGGSLALACGGGKSKSSAEAGAPEAGPSGPGTFKQVSKLMQQSCSGPACHTLPNFAGFTLSMPLYTQLVNAPATGKYCGASGDAGADGGAVHIRVVPGDPDHSLLYQKLAGHPPCGDPMPSTGPLSAAQIELVRSWIAAGANND